MGDIGVFARFPRGRTSCITCPPGRGDHFLLRVLWRGILPFIALNFDPTNWIPKSLIPKKQWAIIVLGITALILLAPPTLLYGAIAECLIESLSTAKENMNTFISALIALALIAVPSYLLSKNPASYNAPTQIMFSLFLAATSTWLGISVNNKRARRDATAKWLPAAETACKQLLTLSSTAERMKRTQAQTCNAIDPILSGVDENTSKPLKAFMGLQCRETSEKLATLRDHIENSISHWQVFIGSNCEGDECRLIDARLQDCRQHLFSQIDEERCRNSEAPIVTQSQQIAPAVAEALPVPIPSQSPGEVAL